MKCGVFALSLAPIIMKDAADKKGSLANRLYRVAAIMLVVYLVLGFAVVPFVVKIVAPGLVSREIEGSVGIGWIWMNPLVFSVSLRNVTVVDPDGEAVVTFDRLYANADPVRSLITGELRAAAFELRGLHVRVAIDADGDINMARAFAPTRPREEIEEARDPIDVPAAVLRRVALTNARIDFLDKSRGIPFEQSITDLNIHLNDIRTHPDHGNAYEFTAVTGADERLHLRGIFQLNPLSIEGSIHLETLNFPVYQPLVDEVVAVEILSGRASGGLEFAFRPLDASPQLGFRDGYFLLEELELRARGAGAAFCELERFKIEGVSLDLFGGKVWIESIVLGNTVVRVERLSDGSIDLLNLLPTAGGANAGNAVASSPDSPAGDPLAFGVRSDGEDLAEPFNAVLGHLATLGDWDWQMGLGRLAVGNIAVDVLDRVPELATAVRLHGIGLSVANFTNEPDSMAELAFQMQINDSGRFRLEGQVGIESLAASLNFELTNMELGDFAPIIETFVPVVLESAQLELSGAASARMEAGAEMPHVELAASLGLRNFSIRQSNPGEPFLAFADLRITDVQAELEPLSVSVAEIAWIDPVIRIERMEDGDLALMALVPEAVAEEYADLVGEEVLAMDEALVEELIDEALAELPIRLELGKFTLENGLVQWIDASVSPTARLVLSSLQVGVRDVVVAPDSAQLASADVSVVFADTGQVTFEGGLIPTDPAHDTAAVVRIREIPMQVFTPYATAAISRPITEGTFGGDFDLRIQSNELDATNQLRVQSLRFGSAVAGGAGAALPVGVAVAALQNRNGLIVLDIPIQGDLDNPDFQPARLFMSILRNAVMRALTAPLSIAGALIGDSIPGLALLSGSGEQADSLDLSSIDFEPGSSALSPQSLRTLDALALFLRERPETQLQITASVDPRHDFEAHAMQALEARLSEVSAPSRSQALRQLYEQTFGGAPVRPDADGDANVRDRQGGPRPGFLLSAEAPREPARRKYLAADMNPRTLGTRGFYTGGQPPARPAIARVDDAALVESAVAEPTAVAATGVPSLREMEQRLLAGFPVDEAFVDSLADEREQAVILYFTEAMGIAAGRLHAAVSEDGPARKSAHVRFQIISDLN